MPRSHNPSWARKRRHAALDGQEEASAGKGLRALVLPLVLLACGPSAPASGPAFPESPARPSSHREPTVSERLDALLEEDLRARPVHATLLGDHRFDARWPDLTPEGRKADHERIARALAALAALATTPMRPDEGVDLQMMEQNLRLQAFEHEVERPWDRDPLWIVSRVGQGLEELVSRDFAPVEARALSLEGRLAALPEFLAQSRRNLSHADVMPPHLEVAMLQCEGLVVLIQQTIPEAIRAASPRVRQAIAGATPQALAALQDFRDHLASLVATTRGPWRLGAEAFERKLALTLQAGIEASDLRRRALLEHREVRDAMVLLAQELAPHVLHPAALRRLGRQAPPDAETALVGAVLEALAEVHGTAAQLRDDAESTLDHLTAFVLEHELVPLDPEEVLTVVWTPPHQRGVFIAGLAAPGPLEPPSQALAHFYYVQPLPPSWGEEVTASYLREYNHFMLEILSIHEAIPGHFVQLYWSKRGSGVRGLSRVRRAYPNAAFIEGWAVYAERVMIEHGYAGTAGSEALQRRLQPRLQELLKTPHLRARAIALHGLKFYLRTVTNAILDAGVHAGTMTREEALELMIEQSFQQRGEAESKWVRAQVTSTQLSTYFAGAQAWKALRERAEAEAARAGTPLELSDFHQEALSHGAPPVAALPHLMGWQPAVPPHDDSAPAARP